MWVKCTFFSLNVGHLERCRSQVEFVIKFPCTGTWSCTAGSHSSLWCLEDADGHPRVRAGRCAAMRGLVLLAAHRREPRPGLAGQGVGITAILLFSADFRRQAASEALPSRLQPSQLVSLPASLSPANTEGLGVTRSTWYLWGVAMRHQAKPGEG